MTISTWIKSIVASGMIGLFLLFLSVGATTSSTSTTQLAISTQEVTTATAIVEDHTNGPTTNVAQVTVSPAPSGSLLDRLTQNKPGIWGNKVLYVGLGVVYIVLLMLFLGLIFPFGPTPE